MSEDMSKRGTFEAKLAEIYSGELTPLNHTADQVRQTAVKALKHSVRWESNFMGYQPDESCGFTWKPLPSGIMICETREAYEGRLGDLDARFSLAYEGAGLVRRRFLGNYWRYQDVLGQTISLLINHDWDKPAAVIGPASNEFKGRKEPYHSAIIVVHDEANDPEHLNAILPVVEHIKEVNWTFP